MCRPQAPTAAAVDTFRAVPCARIDGGFSRELFISAKVPKVLNPFPNIAVDVIQTERVGTQFAHRVCPSAGIQIEPTGLREVRFRVACPKRRCGSSAAGKLPLRFGRQAVAIPCTHGLAAAGIEGLQSFFEAEP